MFITYSSASYHVTSMKTCTVSGKFIILKILKIVKIQYTWYIDESMM